MADEVKTCECTARAALEKCFETGRLHISVDSEEHAALSATCPCEGLREENDRLKLLDAPVEREVRIKYQDIVYAACNLIDRAMGHTISNGVLAERGEFETAIRAIVSERDSLRAELAAADTEAAKLLEYSRSVKGSRDVHSIYEVLDLLPALRAEMATAKSDADRWRKAHDGILAEAARMTSEVNAELAKAIDSAGRSKQIAATVSEALTNAHYKRGL